MRYLGGAVGHKGLPSNRITACSLLSTIAKYLHLCKPTHSLRYPQGSLNAALVDSIWDRAARHDTGADGPGNGPAAEDLPEALNALRRNEHEEAEVVPSDEEDFAYEWDYEEDIEDDGHGEEGGGECKLPVDGETGRDIAAEDDEDQERAADDLVEGEWEDAYDAHGYAPL